MQPRLNQASPSKARLPTVATPRWLQEKKVAERFEQQGPSVIFALGGPGSGKATQCQNITNTLGIANLRVDELLQEEVRRPGCLTPGCGLEHAQVIDRCLREGRTVPGEITVGVLIKTMRERGWNDTKYIVNGFPKNMGDLEAWNRLTEAIAKTMPPIRLIFAISFDCSEANMQKRLIKRGRPSDSIEGIDQRIVSFRQETSPVLKHFAFEGQLTRMDANRDPDKVWHELNRMMIVEMFDYDNAGELKDKDLPDWAPKGSPMKHVWKMRAKQSELIMPSGHSEVAANPTVGPEAQESSSYRFYAERRARHIRTLCNPRDNFVEPISEGHNIGWHENTTPRDDSQTYHPRGTCPMTRHMENMFQTCAQNIIRK